MDPTAYQIRLKTTPRPLWNWSCFTFRDAEVRGIKLGPLSVFIWRRHLCACLVNRWAFPSIDRQLSWPETRS